MKKKDKKKKKFLKPSQLEGYRIPTEDEKQRILNYMKKVLKSQNNMWKVGKFITIVFAVIITSSLVMKLYVGITDYRELMGDVIIGVLSWTSFFAFRKWLIITKELTWNIIEGNYVVLDCVPYWTYYNQDEGRTEGSIRIQTKEGIPCMVNYVVDIETALLCEKEKVEDIPMLLMYQKDTDESYLFSEIMLGYKEKGYYSNKKNLNKKF